VLFERLTPFAHMVASPGATVNLGAVARALGRLAALLGRDDAAEAHFRHALEIHNRMGAPYWTARTQLEYGDFLLARGKPADATAAEQLIDAAHATAEIYGYAGLLKKANSI
jgi:Tfp pilus assembly protein PilF